jgi:hypothetical protein
MTDEEKLKAQELEWRPIAGFDGRYEVAPSGRVWQNRRVDSLGHVRKGRFMKPTLHTFKHTKDNENRKSDSPAVRLINREGDGHWIPICVLLADAFLGGYDPASMSFRFLNGKPQDARLENIALIPKKIGLLAARLSRLRTAA